MKKHALVLTGFTAILILIFAVSFISIPKSSTTQAIQLKPTFGSWWVYDPGYSPGYPLTFSQSIQPSNYRPLRINENIMTLCEGSEYVCAIFADPDPYNPNRPDIGWYTPAYTELYSFFSSGYASSSFVRFKDL